MCSHKPHRGGRRVTIGGIAAANRPSTVGRRGPGVGSTASGFSGDSMSALNPRAAQGNAALGTNGFYSPYFPPSRPGAPAPVRKNGLLDTCESTLLYCIFSLFLFFLFPLSLHSSSPISTHSYLQLQLQPSDGMDSRYRNGDWREPQTLDNAYAASFGESER